MPPLPSARSTLGGALRRFSTLIIVSVILCAGAAGAMSFRSPVDYTGTGVYLVKVGTLPGGQTVSPYDAERLARSDSVIIAEDEKLLTPLAAAVGRSSKGVSDRTTTVSLPNSAAVRVSYRGASRSEVRSYFDALTEQVRATSPPTSNLAAGSLDLLRVESSIPQSGGGSWVATVAGAIAGLLIGIGSANYLGRATPRVSSARELRDGDGPAALDVDLDDANSVAALTIRLLDGIAEGGWLAVVGASADGQEKAGALGRALSTSASQLIDEGALIESASRIRWITAEFGRGGERIAQDSDRTLVVISQGDRLDDVAVRLSDLHDLGVSDLVLAVVRGGTALIPRQVQPSLPHRSATKKLTGGAADTSTDADDLSR